MTVCIPELSLRRANPILRVKRRDRRVRRFHDDDEAIRPSCTSSSRLPPSSIVLDITMSHQAGLNSLATIM
jgi:hypothetical protein